MSDDWSDYERVRRRNVRTKRVLDGFWLVVLAVLITVLIAQAVA